MTRDNVAPAGLPEKEWFTLEEIAGQWPCTEEKILHFGANLLLEMGFIADQVEVIFSESGGSDDSSPPPAFFHGVLPETDEMFQAPEKRYTDDEGNAVGYAIHQGYSEFINNEVREILEKGHAVVDLFRAGTRHTSNFIEAVAVYPGCLNEAGTRYELVDGYRDGSASWSHDQPLAKCRGLKIERGDLVVHRLELDRFEKEYGIGAHAGEMPKATEQLHPRAKHGMLRVIAALDAYIGVPDEPFPAADVILDKLSGCDDLPDRKTLAKYLREAREVTRYR